MRSKCLNTYPKEAGVCPLEMCAYPPNGVASFGRQEVAVYTWLAFCFFVF